MRAISSLEMLLWRRRQPLMGWRPEGNRANTFAPPRLASRFAEEALATMPGGTYPHRAAW